MFHAKVGQRSSCVCMCMRCDLLARTGTCTDDTDTCKSRSVFAKSAQCLRLHVLLCALFVHDLLVRTTFPDSCLVLAHNIGGRFRHDMSLYFQPVPVPVVFNTVKVLGYLQKLGHLHVLYCSCSDTWIMVKTQIFEILRFLKYSKD